jgi:DNA-binding response OmpR family regulator
MANLLIVEDNEDIALLYKRMFAVHQAEIVTSAPAAIDYLQNTKPDLMILDLHLTGSMGVTVLDNVRARQDLDSLPVVVISADDLLKEEIQKKGAAFITKPIDIDQVMTTVDRLLKTAVVTTTNLGSSLLTS